MSRKEATRIFIGLKSSLIEPWNNGLPSVESIRTSSCRQIENSDGVIKNIY